MRLRVMATCVIIFGAIVASISASAASSPNAAFSSAAVALGCTLALAFFIESQAGARNLFRVDIFMLVVLYGLTLLEFLFEQDDLSYRLDAVSAYGAIDATLCAFTGLVLGRHAFKMYSGDTLSDMALSLSPSRMVHLLVGCAFIGYLHILLAVDFNIFEALRQMTMPRFTQSWTRGRFGGIETMVTELGLLIYLVPPLVGAILAEHQRYRWHQTVIAILLLLLTLFFGFAGGTRFIFLTYLATFGASFLMLRRNMSWSALAAVAVPLAIVSGAATYYMISIRTYGLQNWEQGVEHADRFSIDMNILNIAGLMRAFPSEHDFLGLEIPFSAAIRPIPRFLWPGKPEGLSVSIEEVLGAEGLTLSAAYIGELWMAGGLFAVVLGSLVFGAVASGWNRVGTMAQGNLDKILFASGFFAAGLCMRSFLGVAPTILPTVALLVFRYWHYRRYPRHRSRPRTI
jgi:hypothetical protein